MAKIKVHVLNFHGFFSHIELVLENTSTDPHTYYGVNRWASPNNKWISHYGPKEALDDASSIFSFDIEKDPDDIVKKWKAYWNDTEKEAGILGNNCAVAAQWFLTEFAGIPKPSLSNISFNHLAFGILWPSFIPCPVTLPGRVMSNAQFHINAQNSPQTSQYMHLFVYTSLALATLALAASIFALTVAATVLSGGLAALAIAGGAVAVGASSYGFFRAFNNASAQTIRDNSQQQDQSSSIKKAPVPEIIELLPDLTSGYGAPALAH